MPIKVQNKNDNSPAEIMIYDLIGKDWWDDTGIADKDFAEALAKIPKDKEIHLRINSQGGSVKDGLGIYNRLLERRDHVTAFVDGYALSTASWIALAAKKTVIPENAAMMIHNPAGMAFGDSEEMRKVAGVLDQHKTAIISMYRSKTGKTDKEISDAMDAETWFIGKEAKDWGLADEVASSMDIQNNFDLSRFRRVPGAIGAIKNSAAARGGATKENTMKRDEIIALLKEYGQQVANEATDAQLLEQLRGLLKKQTPENKADKAEKATDPETARQIQNILAAITAIQNAADVARKESISGEIDRLIANNQLPANSRDGWIEKVLKDEGILTNLKALPAVLPGAEPVSNHIEVKSDSIADFEKAVKKFKEPTNSFLRGNDVSPKHIADAAIQNALFHRKHRDRILEVMNANTISADLKRNALLQEIMRAFRENLLPLRVFSTVHQNVPLQGTDKVAVPFYPLATAASTDYVQANGYVMGDSDIQDKDVTIDKRKYQPIRFNSSELNRQPAINLLQLNVIKGEKLAADVFANVLSVVTNANYGAASFTGAASTFDSVDVTDLKGVADVAKWPNEGRSLIVKSAYDVNLLKDSSVKAALNFGSADAIQNGTIRKILGFNYYMNDNIPANAENLVGFIVWVSAMLVATSPILPADEVRSMLSAYEVVTDPQLGISFEYRRWGNPDFDERREVIECNYGFNLGDAAALKRMVSA